MEMKPPTNAEIEQGLSYLRSRLQAGEPLSDTESAMIIHAVRVALTGNEFVRMVGTDGKTLLEHIVIPERQVQERRYTTV